MGKKSVLLFENNLTIRDGIDELLRDAGINVIFANSKDDGIAFYLSEQDNIALIILSYGTSPIAWDGAETLRRLIVANPDVKVLAYGYRQFMPIQLGNQQVVSFLTHPFGGDELLSAVKHILV